MYLIAYLTTDEFVMTDRLTLMHFVKEYKKKITLIMSKLNWHM